MSNDRELLELAAKAAGLTFEFLASPLVKAVPDDLERPWRYWNPLADDADALRLATKLRLDIMFFNGFEEVICSDQSETDENVIEPYGDDIDAAVRRAIVRAAAEIGRSMK